MQAPLSLPAGPWDRLAAEALGGPAAAWRSVSRDRGEAWVAIAAVGERRVVLKIHRTAGAWLARLHRLPATGLDAMPLDVAYRRRAAGWLARAAAHLDAETRRRATAAIEVAVPLLAGRERVPCHRDFAPRNRLAERGRLVATIDLEHARPDVQEPDLVRRALARCLTSAR